jgi:hypothetical protein
MKRGFKFKVFTIAFLFTEDIPRNENLLRIYASIPAILDGLDSTIRELEIS